MLLGIVSRQRAAVHPDRPGLGTPAVPDGRLDVEGIVAIGPVEQQRLVHRVGRLVVALERSQSRQGEVPEEEPAGPERCVDEGRGADTRLRKPGGYDVSNLQGRMWKIAKVK